MAEIVTIKHTGLSETMMPFVPPKPFSIFWSRCPELRRRRSHTQEKDKKGHVNLFSVHKMEKEEFDFDYYRELLDVWAQMDQSSWVGFNIFIAFEGVPMAAFVGGVTTDRLSDFGRFLLGLAIALAGLFSTFAWLLILNRRQAALRMVAHQGRVLEDAMFKNRISTKTEDVDRYFPMFFHGNRALFLDESKENVKRTPEEIAILKLHLAGRGAKRWKWLRAFSESEVEAKVIPFSLIALWTALALGVLYVLSYYIHIDRLKWVSFLWHIILPGIFFVILAFIIMLLRRSGKEKIDSVEKVLENKTRGEG